MTEVRFTSKPVWFQSPFPLWRAATENEISTGFEPVTFLKHGHFSLFGHLHLCSLLHLEQYKECKNYIRVSAPWNWWQLYSSVSRLTLLWTIVKFMPYWCVLTPTQVFNALPLHGCSSDLIFSKHKGLVINFSILVISYKT